MSRLPEPRARGPKYAEVVHQGSLEPGSDTCDRSPVSIGRMMFYCLVTVNRPLGVSQFETQTLPLGESKGVWVTCPRMLVQPHQSARFAMWK